MPHCVKPAYSDFNKMELDNCLHESALEVHVIHLVSGGGGVIWTVCVCSFHWRKEIVEYEISWHIWQAYTGGVGFYVKHAHTHAHIFAKTEHSLLQFWQTKCPLSTKCGHLQSVSERLCLFPWASFHGHVRIDPLKTCLCFVLFCWLALIREYSISKFGLIVSLFVVLA